MQRVAAAMAGLAVVVAAPGIATANPPDRGEHTNSPGPRVEPAAPPPHATGPKSDELPNPLAEKQRALRQRAQQMVLKGRVQASDRGGDDVVRVADGQYVELAREDEDSIWTVTAEFGDAAATHDGFTHEGPAGPAHNAIPKPDRSEDNTTIWTENFSEQYYENLLFSEEPGEVSMANFYLEQSSGRYTVNGDVTNWTQVPYNATSYGSNDCDHDGDSNGDDEQGDPDSNVCRDTWLFVNDSVDSWYQSQLESGMTDAEINEYLSQYDVWDRYDHDGDGNFDEPDGYIDHFQSVHAGVGEETGGGAQGSDAIWSHRWYVQLTGIGEGGPTVDGKTVPLGGTQIGDSNYWIGDYTIEPENGGVGVFAHEYAHDLGLPDLYDTSGNSGGAENSTAFWTLMSSGSYGSSGRPEDGIGSKPMHMGVWEKFQLGWLNYEVAQAGSESAHRLGPAETNTKGAQGVFVLLPNKKVPLDLGAPYAGERFYYSGSGDDLDHSMTKEVTVPASDPTLTAQARYDIEDDWDYAYLTVNGQSVPTNLSTTTDPNGQNFGHGITGSSDGEWVQLTADLSEYAGQEVTLGFRYWTDGAVAESGFQADSIALGGTPIGTAESADEGWTLNGFDTTTGSEIQEFFNAYVLANRQYEGYDKSLKTGPYNFGWPSTKPNWVEHFSYQDGLLISYWDASYTDNNVGDHPGGGLILPVDAHPKLEHWTDGTLMRPRLQSYDSTFGLEPTQSYTLHNDGVPSTIESKPAVSVFDDTKSYWTSTDGHEVDGSHPGHHQPGWISVDVPETGSTVRVVNESAQGSFMQVIVNEGQ